MGTPDLIKSKEEYLSLLSGPASELDIAIGKLSESDRKDYWAGRKIFKTDSYCRYILIDNPDRYSSEGNGTRLKKLKRRPTNITPKKKKRKK